MSWKTPRDGNGNAATTRRRRGGMRCRALTAAVDNGDDDDSRSTAHSAMARARRRRDGTPREDPAKGTDADRRGRRARFRRQVPRTTAEAGATGKTTLPTEGAREQ